MNFTYKLHETPHLELWSDGNVFTKLGDDSKLLGSFELESCPHLPPGTPNDSPLWNELDELETYWGDRLEEAFNILNESRDHYYGERF